MTEKQESQKVQTRLREASDRIGVPQYVVMARALELFDEELAEVVAAHVEKFSPDNVTPRAGEKVRGSRLTSGQKAARTRKARASARKAAATRKRNANGKGETVVAMVARLVKATPDATFGEIVELAVKGGANRATAQGALVRQKAALKVGKPTLKQRARSPKPRTFTKSKRCQFCRRKFAPQGLAKHLGRTSKVDCAIKFRKSKKRTK